MSDEEQDIDYIQRPARASILDNSTALIQSERLLKLLQFKGYFKNHKIEIIVDSVSAHSARAYNVFGFEKGISTRCPVDQLQ